MFSCCGITIPPVVLMRTSIPAHVVLCELMGNIMLQAEAGSGTGNHSGVRHEDSEVKLIRLLPVSRPPSPPRSCGNQFSLLENSSQCPQHFFLCVSFFLFLLDAHIKWDFLASDFPDCTALTCISNIQILFFYHYFILDFFSLFLISSNYTL